MINAICKTRKERMHELLMTTFAPTHLLLIDESAQHQGHKGMEEFKKNLMAKNDSNEYSAQNFLETHFSLEISAADLNNLSRVKQHQYIYNVIGEEFKNGLHSLRIKVI